MLGKSAKLDDLQAGETFWHRYGLAVVVNVDEDGEGSLRPLVAGGSAYGPFFDGPVHSFDLAVGSEFIIFVSRA